MAYLHRLREKELLNEISSFFSFDFLPIDNALFLASDYPGSVSQVASQFNCLEFIKPSVTPEKGVTIYADDYTQGPSCAISCGAGTGEFY